MMLQSFRLLMRQGVSVIWSKAQQEAFNTRHSTFMSDHVLILFDLDRDVTIQTQASDYITGGVLRQHHGHGILEPNLYLS